MPAVSAPAIMIVTPRVSQVSRMALNAGVVTAMGRTFTHRRIAALIYGPFTVAGQLMGEQKLLRSVRQLLLSGSSLKLISLSEDGVPSEIVRYERLML